MTAHQETAMERIKHILGDRWLLHPSNKVQRTRPFRFVPKVPQSPSMHVGRVTPFNKTPEQLRSALGLG